MRGYHYIHTDYCLLLSEPFGRCGSLAFVRCLPIRVTFGKFQSEPFIYYTALNYSSFTENVLFLFSTDRLLLPFAHNESYCSAQITTFINQQYNRLGYILIGENVTLNMTCPLINATVILYFCPTSPGVLFLSDAANTIEALLPLFLITFGHFCVCLFLLFASNVVFVFFLFCIFLSDLYTSKVSSNIFFLSVLCVEGRIGLRPCMHV